MTSKFNKVDVLDHLKTEEDRTLYLEACFEEAVDDPAFIAKALGDIAKSPEHDETG
jgi:DNA-binding phage protein